MTREHGSEARKPAGSLRSCAHPAARVDGEHAPQKSGHLAQRPVPLVRTPRLQWPVHVPVCVGLGRALEASLDCPASSHASREGLRARFVKADAKSRWEVGLRILPDHLKSVSS